MITEVVESPRHGRWVIAWSAVAALFVIGLLGSFTIGVFVLPVATIAALAVATVWVRSARTSAGSASTATPSGSASISLPATDVPAVNTLSTIALIMSGASVIVGALAFVGVITGVIALREIRASEGVQSGSGRAVAGIVLGAIVAAVYVTLLATVVLTR